MRIQGILWMLLLVTCSLSALQAQQRETRDVGSFSGIKAAEGIDVYLTHGSREQVKVEVSGSSELDNIVTEVSGSYLKIHMRESRLLKNVDVKVWVTYVSLEKIMVSSAANVFSEEELRASKLEIGASSAGSVELVLQVDKLEAGVSSAGEVDLKGHAQKASFEASSAGKIDAFDLEANSVTADASSAGSVKLAVSDELEAHASSGGNIRYRGNPAKSMTNSSSGGSVRKSD